MFKKLIAAAICGAFIASISGHAEAAGPGGFARGFAAIEQTAVASIKTSSTSFNGCTLIAGRCATKASLGPSILTEARRTELARLNVAINSSMNAMDDFFTSFDTGGSVAASMAAANECGDCASIKRQQLIGRGWSADALSLAFALNDDGSLERVLIVDTDKGSIVLGNRPHAAAQTDGSTTL
jgi:predicted transglutaminase-like cysteine proteinase